LYETKNPILCDLVATPQPNKQDISSTLVAGRMKLFNYGCILLAIFIYMKNLININLSTTH